jgi:hypothetical protein
MTRFIGALTIALAVLVSGWLAASVTAQSTIVAPHVREVNSELIHELLESIDALIETLTNNAAVDSTHDNDSQETGPLVQAECDDTATDAIDEGDSGKTRMDCTTRALRVTATASAAGGATGVTYNSAGATEDKHAVCTGPCTLYSLAATNHNAAIAFLRCENDTAANTTPGSETVEFDLAIPGSATGAGVAPPLPSMGIAFSTALTCWVVTGEAQSDVAEVAANDVKLFYGVKQ